MFYSMTFYRLKPGVDIADLSHVWDELAVPIIKKIPGLISIESYKCSTWDGSPSEWEYIYLETWENKDAHGKALGVYVGPGSEIEKSGVYEKVFGMTEFANGFYGSSIR
jgi:hypothetical protein